MLWSGFSFIGIANADSKKTDCNKPDVKEHSWTNCQIVHDTTHSWHQDKETSTDETQTEDDEKSPVVVPTPPPSLQPQPTPSAPEVVNPPVVLPSSPPIVVESPEPIVSEVPQPEELVVETPRPEVVDEEQPYVTPSPSPVKPSALPSLPVVQHEPRLISKPELTFVSDIPIKSPVVVLDNGVILSEEVAKQIELLQNPTELISELFTNPMAALAAFGAVGMDMSPTVRKKSQDAVVQAVIVGSIVSQAAGAATYRRKP